MHDEMSVTFESLRGEREVGRGRGGGGRLEIENGKSGLSVG